MISFPPRLRYDQGHLRDRLLQEGREGPAARQVDGPRVPEGWSLHRKFRLLVSDTLLICISLHRPELQSVITKKAIQHQNMSVCITCPPPAFTRVYSLPPRLRCPLLPLVHQVIWGRAVGNQHAGRAAVSGPVQ